MNLILFGAVVELNGDESATLRVFGEEGGFGFAVEFGGLGVGAGVVVVVLTGEVFAEVIEAGEVNAFEADDFQQPVDDETAATHAKLLTLQAGAVAGVLHGVLQGAVVGFGDAVDFSGFVGGLTAFAIDEDHAFRALGVVAGNVVVAEGGPKGCPCAGEGFEASNAIAVEADDFVEAVDGGAVAMFEQGGAIPDDDDAGAGVGFPKDIAPLAGDVAAFLLEVVRSCGDEFRQPVQSRTVEGNRTLKVGH